MGSVAAARGLVESVPNPAHQRSSLIRLTDAGRAAITAVLDREHLLLRQAGGIAVVAALVSLAGLVGWLVRRRRA